MKIDKSGIEAQEFARLYENIIDAFGNLHNVGREKCIELICLADSLTDTKENYGNTTTGFLSLEELSSLYRLIKS